MATFIHYLVEKIKRQASVLPRRGHSNVQLAPFTHHQTTSYKKGYEMDFFRLMGMCPVKIWGSLLIKEKKRNPDKKVTSTVLLPT